MGVGFKIIKMSVSLYDCFFREYELAEIGSKKINVKIYKKYFTKVLDNFLFLEFIKNASVLYPEMKFKVKGVERVVIVK